MWLVACVRSYRLVTAHLGPLVVADLAATLGVLVVPALDFLRLAVTAHLGPRVIDLLATRLCGSTRPAC